MSGASVGTSYDLAVARFQNTLTGISSPTTAGGLVLDCYPDPFKAVTWARFRVPYSAQVTLSVHDATGRKVATLANERLPAGRYERSFEAGKLAPGVYVFRLQAGAEAQIRKAILAR